jgi:hypothetical protein
MADHFGKQLKKARLSHGWTLLELGRRMGIDAAHLGRVESGKRPPSENVALAADHVFPERDGWFHEYYLDSQTWMHPQFRDWQEIESSALRLVVWAPAIVHGLAQCESYARALLQTMPGVTADQVKERLAARMKRQTRVLDRDEPPVIQFLVDQPALYRAVGSAEVMVDQLQHLLDLSQRPRVTVQAVPNVGHAAIASELIIADDAAYCEHINAGGVYSGTAFTRLETLAHTLSGECFRVSETQEILREAIDKWNQ